LNSAEELLKSASVIFPGIGTAFASITGASFSFGTTFYSLKVFLSCFEKVLLDKFIAINNCKYQSK